MTDVFSEQDDILLCQYLDNELADDTRAAVEQRLAREPKLRARLQTFQSLDSNLKDSLLDADAGEVPGQVEALLRSDNIVPLQRPPSRLVPLGLAAAALAAVSFTAGLQFYSPPPAGFAGADALSSGALSRIMEQSPSTVETWYALGDEARVRPVLTFPASEESYCREYQLQSRQSSWRGVACRRLGTWVTELLVPASLGDDGDYFIPASAGSQRALDRFVEAEAAGEAMGAEQEAGLIDRGWR